VAVRQRGIAERESRGRGLDRQSMAVEVVTRRDLPVEQHAVAAVCEGGEHEGLVDGQELVFVGGRAEQSLPSCKARSGDGRGGLDKS
jgi:hypothetical protein